MARQPAISFSNAFHFPFNRAGGRTSNVLQKMDTNTKPDIVRCADQMHRIFWSGMWRKTLCACIVWAICAAISWAVHAEWPMFIGVVAVGATIAVPQIIRIQRGYTRQTCPSCGNEVGGYDSGGSRVYLVCHHCGARTATDCAIQVIGGPPSKIE